MPEFDPRRVLGRVDSVTGGFPLRGARLALACAGLFLVCMAGSFICMDRGINPYDEGLILFGAQRVEAGDLPYRDFYANYGPGSFYVLSWLFRLFSPSVLIERVWDSGVRSAIVVLVVLLVRGSSRGVPLVTGVVTLLWLLAYGFYGYPVFPVLMLTLAGALALVPVFAGDRQPWRLVVAGVVVGSIGLFRYDAAFAACVCTIFVLLAFAIRVFAGDSPKAVGTLLIPFLTGLAMVAAPVGVYDLLTGTLPDLWLDTVVIPAQSYAAMRALPLPDLHALLSHPLEIGGYVPILIAAAGTVVLVIDGRNSQGRHPLFWLALLLLLFTLVFIAKGYVRFSAIHMGMALVTSVVMLGCLARLQSPSGKLRPVLLAIGFGVIGLGTLPALRVDLERAARNTQWLARGADCTVPPGLDRMRCFVFGRNAIEAISYIKRVTEPGTPLFVGLGRHDKILVNDVAFYFLAARPSATKWHHMDPGVQTTEPIQREMVAELRAKAPPFVVLETTWDEAHEPNRSAISSGVTLLDDYILSAFSLAKTFGNVQVWARREPHASIR